MSTETLSFTDQVEQYLTENDGPQSAAALAEALDKSEAVVKGAFTRLANEGRVVVDEEGNATLPTGQITEVIRSRTARSSGVQVDFLRTSNGYAARCAHGTIVYGAKRYETARMAANPDDWCAECATLAAERKAARKAKRAKVKATV